MFGSSMAGSLAGQAIGNTMFGGSSAPAAEAAAPAAPQQGYAPQQMAAPVCSFESRQFLECMTASGEQMDQCRQYFDAFKMCQQYSAQQ